MRALAIRIAAVALLFACEGTEQGDQASQATSEEVPTTDSASPIWFQPNSTLLWAVADQPWYSFEEAVAACTEMTAMNKRDWRLPTVTELQRAISFDIAEHGDSIGMWEEGPKPSDFFWTLDPDDVDQRAFRIVRLSDGEVSLGGSNAGDAFGALCIAGQPLGGPGGDDPTNQIDSSAEPSPTVSPSPQSPLNSSPSPSPSLSPSPTPSPDITPPTVTISSTVPTSIDNTVSGADGSRCYTFNVSTGVETAVTLYSKVDAQGWVQKPSGTAFSVCVSVGQHTFSVKGIDAALNESTPVSRTWTMLGKYYEQSVGGGTVIRHRVDTGSSASPYWFTPLYAAELWADANNGCNGLTYAGYSDWTLPSSAIAKEWNAGSVKNFISGASGKFWTSTTSQTISGTVWKYTNDFSTSSSSGESEWPTNQTAGVRCIRLGS